MEWAAVKLPKDRDGQGCFNLNIQMWCFILRGYSLCFISSLYFVTRNIFDDHR